ncbi:MAG: CDP-diacylglycerol--glycerol-3-phosphate 3-phosphatidyltransferase [Nitrospirae bacterium]|nr:MAG: CDP-diacylglycerol--glycerol-3-phosphate 3-phosphatidyltransferase [Nitrospirota bacterium]
MKVSEVHALKASPAWCSIAYRNLNLPNCLTISRICLIPVFVLLFINPTEYRSILAALVFSAAAGTDFLDGYIARRRGQITNLGKFLDPVADKLLVVSGLILLVQVQRVEVWIVIAMIARELIVTGFRAVAAREGIIVPAGVGGKIKVICQILGILCLILEGVTFLPSHQLHVTGTVILIIALIFSLASGFQYIFEMWRASPIGSEKCGRKSDG